jgi:hypothetical protein
VFDFSKEENIKFYSFQGHNLIAHAFIVFCCFFYFSEAANITVSECNAWSVS